MNRRGFFRRLGGLIGAVSVGLVAIKHNPLPKPQQKTNVLTGYKGANFMQTGFVYAPYIPLIQSCMICDPPAQLSQKMAIKMTPHYPRPLRLTYSKNMIHSY